jgi:serine/threonine protein kinase
MSEQFTCPCGHQWEGVAPATVAGAQARCPSCGQSRGSTAGPDAVGTSPQLLTLSSELPPLPSSSFFPVISGYEILEELGHGGMGRVFKARQVHLDRIVAIKVILPERLSDSGAFQRFQREARAIARLSHPNIVTVHDCGLAGGTSFLVLEYVEGTDLARRLRAGPLPVGQACEYIRQTALALQHAHERGLVHRDVKPGNLLLDAAGTKVKVLDLGLALLVNRPKSDSPSTALTGEGTVLGTLAYLAPEQALAPHRVDIRADLYSLGCTFYELLTGTVPFPGASFAEVVLLHQSGQPRAIRELRPEVSYEVARIVEKLMAKRPEDRYQTPTELATALSSLSTATEVSPPIASRRRLAWLGLAGAAAVLLALLAWWVVSVGQKKTVPPSSHDDHRTQTGLAAIVELGGKIQYDERDPTRSVESTNLDRAVITDADLAHLEGLTTLKRLDLVGTPIGDAGLVHLRTLRGLLWLELSSTQVTDKGLAELSGLTDLEWLYLNYTKIGDTGLKHLQTLTRLKTLQVGGTAITDGGLQHLERLPQLSTLTLYNTRIGSHGLKRFAFFPSLADLNMANTLVDDDDLVHLAELPHLRVLTLDGTQVSDVGLIHLKKLKDIEAIYVKSTKVTEVGAAALRKALPQAKIER